MAFINLLAQASEGAPAAGGLTQFIPFILIFVAMYFFLIAPQRKKDKAHKQMLSELKNGDKVVTIGGIFGTITHIKSDRYQIKVDDNTRIEILKSAIQTRQSEES